ncbi:stage II sporulation protein P [Tenuibacillus multivorans]|uniref:stage II sporulation protein P n=1 Tax=Tenuibacillus multivorans TaxID=237069 RepID=UPI001C992FAB|nr:stage II sporulation protein P [Tenuibacillus multivorans]
MKRINQFKKHPFLLFQVLFVCLILLIPILSIKPFHEASTNVLQDWVKHIDGASFSYFMTIDQPILDGLNEQHDQQLSLSGFALPLLTNLPYQDIRLLFGHELPRFPNTNSTIAVAGEGTNMFTTSFETEPPDYLFEEETEDPPPQEPQPDVNDESVFIYTTHNRESFLPHLPEGTKTNETYHATENVMKLSQTLHENLESYGLEAYVDQTDFWQLLPQGQYGKSYDISREVVQNALSDNGQIKYLIDIHRDSKPRSETTTTVNGQTMARLMFVVGGENESHKENLQFANRLHQILEEKYPGLSRGVDVKAGPGTNGVFNQDLSGHSVVVEVGGIENNFEELNLSIDALADIFSQYYFEQEGAESQ